MSGEFNRSELNGDAFASPSAAVSTPAPVTSNGSAPGSPVVPLATPAAAVPGNTMSSNGIPKPVEDVMYSDIGVSTLLNRLKQSIASARDFAAFLKKRSTLEEEQATALKRLAKSQLETLRRAEVKTGSYATQLAEVMRVHERMADNGMQFALSLHQMHEDLNELSANMERGRKQWKHEGLDAEKRASDAEGAMQKAKSRYDGLAEDYDRARTGDTKGSKRLGLKGPKSAEQYEQDLLRKTQAADQEYGERVKSAKSQRETLLSNERPKAVKALLELIRESDSALALQLQKFATFNEKLLLGNGLAVTPLTGADKVGGQHSLRDIIYEIDNETDFNNYIRGHSSKVPARAGEIKYEQHPTFMPKTQKPNDQRPPTGGQTFSHSGGQQTSGLPPALSLSTAGAAVGAAAGAGAMSQAGSANSRYNTGSQPQSGYGHQASPSAGGGYQQQPPPAMNQMQSPSTYGQQAGQYQSAPAYSASSTGYDKSATAPPYPTHPSERNTGTGAGGYNNPQQTTGSIPGPPGRQNTSSSQSQPNLPPLRPVFGVSLEDLFARDQTAVPMIVIQCILAVDTFGLDVEGIYRLSGTASHINSLKQQFDHNSATIDFRNPAAFFHDVNSVATLLKQFFRDLPDPLFTSRGYATFIEAAKIEDEGQRRDALHQGINDLPDPNYATLRALVLHMNRVMQNEGRTRMGSGNLAVCFAPSLMGTHTGPQIADAGLQARVLDTILVNATAIFDED